MKEEALNKISQSNFEDFKRFIFETNSALVKVKLIKYGIEEDVKTYPIDFVLKEKSHKDGVDLHDRTLINENRNIELKRQVLKNPFKQKLKILMGL